MGSEMGAKALAGQLEYIAVLLFDDVDYDRKITGSGKSIICFDAKADDNVNLWEYRNFSITDQSVPAGHKVRAIGANVKFT